MTTEQTTTAYWTRSLNDVRAVEAGCYFDAAEALKVARFAERVIRQATGRFAGQPFYLVPWQWYEFIAPLFGWRRADGSRRFRRFGLYIPKKNGKTALLAMLTLYLLLADNEPEAEVYSCAADRSQAKLIFNEAERMVRNSPILQSRVVVRKSISTIRSVKDGSFYKALSADVETKDGPGAHAVFFDELHTQTTRRLWAALRYAGRARRQPLLGWITTAGRDCNRLWYDELQYARKVLAGEVEDWSFLPVLYEAAEGDDWTSEEVWRKANPSMGYLFDIESMRESFWEVKNKSPNEQIEWRRLMLNQIVRSESAWVSIAAWRACGRDKVELPSVVYGALDLASTRDLCAFTLGGWLSDGSFATKTWFYCPEAIATTVERRNRELFVRWHQEGRLIFTPGVCTDWDWLFNDVYSKCETYRPQAVAFDPYNAGPVISRLDAKGIPLIQFGQRYATYNTPCREFERLVYSKKFVHENCPVLEWMIGNVRLAQDTHGNVMPDRAKSTDKIDGVATNLMALGLAIKTKPTASVYEERGV